MIAGLASVLCVTIDRFDVSSRVIEQNLKNCGYPCEFLFADNGSKDGRIVEFLTSRAAYRRVNGSNEGVGRSFNQLYLRAKGEFICLMGNDIEMPDHWLSTGVAYLKAIPNAGLVAFDWGHGSLPPMKRKFGIEAHWVTPHHDRVFGTMVFKRHLVDEIGLFHEGYGPYGMEDSDFCVRATIAGFNSCYVREMKSSHLIHDVGEQTEYRRVKDESLKANAEIYMRRAVKFEVDGVREPLPPQREPLP